MKRVNHTGQLAVDRGETDCISFNEQDGLKCPHCGGVNLCQGAITVYDRTEDAEVTTVTTVDSGLVSSHRVASDHNNPSARRNGFTVRFSCESCPAEPLLRIWQHKGTSYCDWRWDEEATLKKQADRQREISREQTTRRLATEIMGPAHLAPAE